MRPAIFMLLLLCLAVSSARAAAPAPPAVAGEAWLLIDHDSGTVLAEHNGAKRLPPASLTKLVTAYLVFEKLRSGELRLEEPVLISSNAWSAPGSRVYLRLGSYVTIQNLIMSMIVRSANDATVALAERISGSEEGFVAQMNARAHGWGLTDSHFENATGLDHPRHVSTARDMSRIAAAIIRDFPEYYKWFGAKEFSYHALTHHNSNSLLWRDAAVDGMKTGHTRLAGYCLISSARRSNMRLIATVLGSPSITARTASSQALLDYGFQNFETRLVYATQSPATQVRVWMGDREMLPLTTDHNVYLTLPRGWHDRLRARLTIKDMLVAPVRAGQKIGVVALALDEQVFAEYPLVAMREISTGGVLRRAIDRVQLWLR